MTRSDLDILFTALGFLALVMKGENAEKDSAKKAVGLADLIKAFCKETRPELFHSSFESTAAELDQIIEDMKEDELQFGQTAHLLENKQLMHKILDRLLERHRAYATDEMIVGEVAHFLEEEIQHKTEVAHDGRLRAGK